jgi:hypothetical protein
MPFSSKLKIRKTHNIFCRDKHEVFTVSDQGVILKQVGKSSSQKLHMTADLITGMVKHPNFKEILKLLI